MEVVYRIKSEAFPPLVHTFHCAAQVVVVPVAPHLSACFLVANEIPVVSEGVVAVRDLLMMPNQTFRSLAVVVALEVDLR